MTEPDSNKGEVPDYAARTPVNRRRIYTIIAKVVGVVALVAVLLMLVYVFLENGPPSEKSIRLYCASNLRQIDRAILFYADENQGRYPDDLATLVLTTNVDPGVFVCPESRDMTPNVTTREDVAKALNAGGHLSFIYLGKRLTTKTATAQTVVAYEPLTNHKGDGSNVLFGDGHVVFLAASDIESIEAKIKSTIAPVTMPTSP